MKKNNNKPPKSTPQPKRDQPATPKSDIVYLPPKTDGTDTDNSE